MALIDKLVKITDYTGIYFKDDRNLGIKEIKISELQKKIKAPYILVSRYYEGKKARYKTINILDERQTLKRNCDELQAERNVEQIQKSFKVAKPKKLTLKELFDEYIQNKQQSEKWKQIQKYYMDAHLGAILNLPIDNIETRKLQTLTNTMLKTHKPRTVEMTKQILRSMFNYAIKHKYISENPAKFIEIPKYDNQIYFELSDNDAERLYSAIAKYPDVKIKAVFTFLLNGRRRGEALQMRWEYLDFNSKQYTTPYTITKPGKTITYPLSDDIIETLQDLVIQKEGYIFTNDTTGEPLKDIRWHWSKLLEMADIKEMRLHDLRHLIGFRASKAGVPLQAISKVLGHSSIQVTQRYANTDTATIASVLELVKPKQ